MKDLDKLTKQELLNIIGKMKKKDLIYIIENKIGGEIIKKTKNAVRESIEFNLNKANTPVENVMANNNLYKNI